MLNEEKVMANPSIDGEDQVETMVPRQRSEQPHDRRSSKVQEI